ncbi:alkaline phosphatase family protein [Aliamphritea hakodatensis]|uniref:alkaline phosphatase family protein n=1 Tax=Aliamphritea hakodatensis TaxID=2895352 RepID=UPI0022FD8412|nr:alkaline phosphatase family protein [Aliamphritea hakodatensis]
MIKNVLLITADQWRGTCLSALGHPVVKTPNLDRLASEGVTFTRHYSQATPCSPSRASIHTGMYQHNHRVCRNGTPLHRRFTNLAQEARKLDFEPALFGYTDTALDPATLEDNSPDFQSYETVLPGYDVGELLTEVPLNWFAWLVKQGVSVPDASDFHSIYTPLKQPDDADRGATYGIPCYSAEQTETAFLRQQAQDYISQQEDAPWFIHLSWIKPHPPFVAPEPYNSMYDPADVDMPVRHGSIGQEMEQHPYVDFYLRNALAQDKYWNVIDGKGLGPDMPEKELRQLRATYYGLISEVDAQFGELYAFLAEHQLLENTLIVFSSDHGEQLGDHYLSDKQGFFDQSYHIPLIIRAPGNEWDAGRGRQVSRFTENIDIMPTVLNLLGADIPLQCDGYSLQPFLAGQTNISWRSAAHWEHDFRDIVSGGPESQLGLNLDECSLAVIRDEEFKYVHFNQLPPLLFDMQADPGELNNLADNPDYAQVALKYAQKMLSWRMSSNERTLTGWHYHSEGPSYRADNQRGDLKR